MCTARVLHVYMCTARVLQVACLDVYCTWHVLGITIYVYVYMYSVLHVYYYMYYYYVLQQYCTLPPV